MSASELRGSFAVMGIVNVTPDSFSDGGAYLDAGAAVAHAVKLAGEGAELLDIGGESTRPGAEAVGVDEELRRVMPVLEGIATHGIRARVSIDTSKSVVARAALDAGASLVNDVTALRGDPAMAELVAEAEVDCCLMHMLGEPRTMQEEPRYEDVVDDVKAFLLERLALAVDEGIDEQRVLLDPGIGFGKTVGHNLALLARIGEIVAIGRPVVIGTSRKGFIGRLLADASGLSEPPAPEARLAGTIATNLLAFERGASVFRVHDVGAHS